MRGKSIVRMARLLEFLRAPDYLHDLHSAFFAILVGSALLVATDKAGRRFLVWGILVLCLGFFRLLAVASGDKRLHSASCLVSLMSWLFFVIVFISRGAYVIAAAFLTFAIASALRYLQVEYWRIADADDGQ